MWLWRGYIAKFGAWFSLTVGSEIGRIMHERQAKM